MLHIMESQRLIQLQGLFLAQPNDSFVLFALAKEYEKLGQPAQALEYYLKLQQTNPDYLGLYYHLGKLYEILNQTDKAIATYQDGMVRAKAAGDLHTLSELAGAKLNLTDD